MILSESEKNRIRGLYGLVTEQQDIVDIAIEKIKGEDFYDDAVDINKLDSNSFIEDLLKSNPELSKIQDELKKELDKIDSLGEDELNDYIDTLSKKIINSGINEQTKYPGLGVFVSSFGLALIYAIKKAKKDRKLEREQAEQEKQRQIEREKEEIERRRREEEERIAREKREEEENKVFSSLKGQTVNLYNDSAEQVLYGRIQIQKLRFRPEDQIGGRSSIAIYDNDGYKYEIICLSNPDRLAPYVVEKGNYIDDFKYNRRFVNVVKQRAGNFCKKPKATFGSIDKPTDSSKIA